MHARVARRLAVRAPTPHCPTGGLHTPAAGAVLPWARTKSLRAKRPTDAERRTWASVAERERVHVCPNSGGVSHREAALAAAPADTFCVHTVKFLPGSDQF